MTTPFDDAVIEEWKLPTRHLAQRTLVYPCLESTNSFALEFSRKPENHGLAILAQEQTAGRGQHGRTWVAPPRSSILLTLLIFPPPPLHRPSVLTAWAAVAVCETILEVVHQQAKIKWPNDVLILGKKVCGILIEQRNTGISESPLATAVGIGLNVTQDERFFADAGLSATSLSIASGLSLEIRSVAEALLRNLDDGYGRLLEGDTCHLQAMWEWRIGLLGKRVAADRSGGTHVGRLLEVNFDSVLLELDDGERVSITPEHICRLTAERRQPND